MQLLVAPVDDELDDVLEHPVHRVGEQLEPVLERIEPARLVARRQAEPVVEVVLARGARLAPDALVQPDGAEREDSRVDRLLERPVAARQLRGDRAAVLGVARHRRAVHQHRRSLVAAVPRAGPHRGVKNDQVVTHDAASYERDAAGGRATLFESDSEGNLRARPSPERPLPA